MRSMKRPDSNSKERVVAVDRNSIKPGIFRILGCGNRINGHPYPVSRSGNLCSGENTDRTVNANE